MRSKTYSGKGIKRDLLIKQLTTDFEEDPIADKHNLVNEKQLNIVMNKIIKTNKKAHKPISTRSLLTKSQ